MTKNKITDLRDHLFVALERLNDSDLDAANSTLVKQEVERAKAISNLSNSIIGTAKAEVEFLKLTGRFSQSTNFIGDGKNADDDSLMFKLK